MTHVHTFTDLDGVQRVASYAADCDHCPPAITTPCLVCAVQARLKHSAFYAARGPDWPLTQAGGHAVHRACARDAESLIGYSQDGTLTVTGGVGRWATNGRAIPGDCAALAAALGLAPGLDLAATAAANDAEAAEAIARYRDRQPAEAPAEERAEMLAAFGPGTEVVDVITGRVTRL
jgi:hypothetical protein